jgi:hypothetical protein
VDGTFRLSEVDGWLDFQEGPWTGARVNVRLATPLGLYFDILAAINSRTVATLRAGLRAWADAVLIEWNITDPAGEPIPATADGLERLPLPGATMIVRAWLNKVPDVDLPLQQLPAGGTSGDS